MAEHEEATGFEAARVTELTCTACGIVMDVSDGEPFSAIACPECGAEQIVPARIGEYLVHGFCGRGGMGTVYRGWDPSLNREVAIKVLQTDAARDSDEMRGFEREAQAAARLNHPHIAQVYTFGYHIGQPYIVMELVGGDHFDEMIRTDQPMSQALVLQICLEIAEGLQDADDVGLLHGDIKPENILLDERRRAKLVDFGLATSVGDSGGDKVRGTPYYIPPERLERKALNARSDIYSLGATMYHALAGRPPFYEGDAKEVALARLAGPPAPLRELREDVDPQVHSIVMRMIERDPARRYPTYASLIGDMGRAMRSLGGDPRGKKTHRGRTVRVSGRQGTVSITSDMTSIGAGRYAGPQNRVGTPAYGKGRKTVGIVIAAVVALVVIGGGIAGALLTSRAKANRAARATANAAALLSEASLRLEQRYTEGFLPHLASMQSVVAQVTTNSLQMQKESARYPADAALRRLNTTAASHLKSAKDFSERLDKADRAARSAYDACAASKDVIAIEKSTQLLGSLDGSLLALERNLRRLTEENEKLKAVVDAALVKAQGSTSAAQAEAKRRAEEATRAAAAAAAAAAETKRARAADKAAVEELFATLKTELAAYRYDEIVVQIDAQRAKCSDPDLKVMLDLSSQQVRLMASVKDYIQKALAARPIPKGWRQNGHRLDIRGATDKGIDVMGRIIAWSDVPKEQMLLFVNALIPRAQVPPPEQGRLLLGGAMFCRWAEERDLADKYRAQAIKVDPSLEELADKIAPPSPAPDAPERATQARPAERLTPAASQFDASTTMIARVNGAYRWARPRSRGAAG